MLNRYGILPLTKQMIEILQDCHKRELQNSEPCDASTLKSISALVKRGALTTKPYITKTGKQFVGAYITELGKKLINVL